MATAPAKFVIEYPCKGRSYSHSQYGVFAYCEVTTGTRLVKSFRKFIDHFKTLDEARMVYPYAVLADGLLDSHATAGSLS